MDMEASERLRRQMIEVCPFRLGQRVTVSPDYIYAGDWRDVYVIVGLQWDYNKGAGHSVNVAIASDDEIIHRHGWTDGFALKDLVPAQRAS